MAKAKPYVPPPDPDFASLAQRCEDEWRKDRPSVVAFDTETTGVTWNDTPFCATLQWPGGSPHYLEFTYASQQEREHRYYLLEQVLHGADTWIGHNIKFDIQMLLRVGVIDRQDVTPERIHDTEALAHLDDEHRPKGLKDLAVSVLGYDDNIEVEVKSGPNKGRMRKVPREKHELETVRRKLKLTKEDGYHPIPRAIIYPYALKDAEFTLSLYERLRPRVERYADLWGLYQQEMSLTCTLIDMEGAGLGIVKPYVDATVKEYAKTVLQHELDIEQIVGKQVRTGKIPPKERANFFNPSSSSPDVGNYFAEHGLAQEKYDRDHLKLIDHPLARKLIEYRKAQKMLSTYLIPMQKEQRQGVLHPSFRQHGTVTGRMSSGEEQG